LFEYLHDMPMSELAPPEHPAVRRRQRLDGIKRREQQISMLQVQQRQEIAALVTEDRAGLSTRYVPDELAMVMRRSVRQARNRVDGAQLFVAFPAVHAKIADGSWFLDHADAVLDELVGSGLDHDEQQQVLDLVLERGRGRTPWELRQQVRTAMVVLFPAHALDRAEKAKTDRDVRSYVEAPGVASLHAYGPAPDIAAMMACLDAMTFPPAPDDTRTVAQRRFDTLRALVCGQVQPGNWQAFVLVGLATVEGEDELPAEIPGFGPIPAAQARKILAQGASVRRVVVDEHGQLLAVDDRVHRPDLPPPPPAPGRSDLTPPADPDTEPAEHPDEDDPDGTGGTPHGPRPGGDGPGPADHEPDPPSADDLTWYDDTTDRDAAYSCIDALRAADRTPPAAASAATPMPQAQAGTSEPTRPLPAPSHLSWQWSDIALARALHRVRTDPLHYLDLSSDRYAIPKRLKRFLELRDRTCVFPGCTRLSRRCDKDHLIPWPRGRTTAVNLANECEHHHQGKHDCLTVHRLPDGTYRWTTPAGITADHPPRPVLLGWAYRPLREQRDPAV
jgi:hypothetical protein